MICPEPGCDYPAGTSCTMPGCPGRNTARPSNTRVVSPGPEQRAGGVPKLKVLDLFSGIGGFSLGLERTGGFETVAFCEIEEFPRKVLAKHWPQVPFYRDVRELTAERLAADGIAADVITGGFPCQDLSIAGRRAGIEGERSGLWSEVARLVDEVAPAFLLVENVTNLLSGPSEQPGGWFGRVLGDLAEIGYDAEWHCIPASYLGAWHRRDRVWLLAYPNKERGQQGFSEGPIFRQRDLFQQPTRGFARWAGRSNLPKSRICGRHDGVPDVPQRLAALGNAVVPQIPELIGRAILEAISHSAPMQREQSLINSTSQGVPTLDGLRA